jgi:hypothetical protein
VGSCRILREEGRKKVEKARLSSSINGGRSDEAEQDAGRFNSANESTGTNFSSLVP